MEQEKVMEHKGNCPVFMNVQVGGLDGQHVIGGQYLEILRVMVIGDWGGGTIKKGKEF